MQWTSVCSSEKRDIFVAKVSHFGWVSRGFEQNVHIFAPSVGGFKKSQSVVVRETQSGAL